MIEKVMSSVFSAAQFLDHADFLEDARTLLNGSGCNIFAVNDEVIYLDGPSCTSFIEIYQRKYIV